MNKIYVTLEDLYDDGIFVTGAFTKQENADRLVKLDGGWSVEVEIDSPELLNRIAKENKNESNT